MSGAEDRDGTTVALSRLQARADLERGTARDPDEVARIAGRYLAQRVPESERAETSEEVRDAFAAAIDHAAGAELVDARGELERALPENVRGLVDDRHASDRRLMQHAANVAQGRVRPLRDVTARSTRAPERVDRSPDVGYGR